MEEDEGGYDDRLYIMDKLHVLYGCYCGDCHSFREIEEQFEDLYSIISEREIDLIRRYCYKSYEDEVQRHVPNILSKCIQRITKLKIKED